MMTTHHPTLSQPGACVLPVVDSNAITLPTSRLQVLAISRIMVSWQPVGAAMGVFDMCARYAKERQQFGTPIGGFQLVRVGARLKERKEARAGEGWEPKRENEKTSRSKAMVPLYDFSSAHYSSAHTFTQRLDKHSLQASLSKTYIDTFISIQLHG